MNLLLLIIIIIIIMITKVLITMAVLCERSRGTLHSLATWIEISPGLVGKQWLTIELSRWQSSHRRRYSGRYDSHQKNREILDPVFSIQVPAYSSRKPWRLQFHNSELNFRTRPPNLCSHRRCDRNFVPIPTHFYHATTLQLRAFARRSASWPAGPMTIRHFDTSFFSF